MTPHGHPPAPDYGPVVRLPSGYEGHLADWCPTCDTHPDGLCPDHLADARDTAREDEARARWEEGD